MSFIFLFIDGIGMSASGPENPFSNEYASFVELCGDKGLTSDSGEIKKKNHVYIPVDARLDVEGLPQSGTGQTALFTGLNAAKHIGKHFGPFPHSGIKPMLKTQSIFHRMIEMGKRPVFMNAYPPVFFQRSEKRNRWTCTTLMAKSAGQKLHSVDEVLEGKAVTAEFFGDFWRERLGIQLPKRDGKDIADILFDAAEKHDLVLMEYYLTDKAGHAMDYEFANEVLQRLDRVLLPLIEHNTKHTIVICSDHGNLEDLSTKSHTMNPVPLIAIGEHASAFEKNTSIMDVPNTMIKALSSGSA